MAPNVNHNATLDHDFHIMVQIDMEMEAFNSNWTHCDYISTFLARMISHNRPDSVLFTNLFSSALNELLEITFRSNHVGGTFVCKISRQGDTERVELTFTCSQDERDFFKQAVARLRSSRAEADYMDSLADATEVGRDMLLVELAVSYSAAVTLTTVGDDTITLTVDLPLGGLTH
ncbi:ubiquinone biosynthesis methyltransferase UbiE [Labrys okinawensis]|uniref:Ubiquinone biosynthesis methyltransferase UbiE n=1 Tax=Labrys okinawensis TaxID=346911 RepID=A0A2S9Q642_9HYPH|nr:ubiquinone biosynthesis methyltransferase UbiE [Labrys okinawensis]PRH84816.1 ubiquinone biosynthesis methyltransferase UbiE [Labrys okinawensis]